MKYYKKDEQFLKDRRLFIRNVGLTLAAFGFAPDIRLDLTKRLLIQAKLNTAFAFEIGNEKPKTAFEFVFRTSFNGRKLMMPACAADPTRPEMAHVWAGSKEANTPADIAQAIPVQSPTTGNWFAPGEMFDKLKDIPMATFMWQRLGGGNHNPNHSVRNGVQNSANEEGGGGRPCPVVLHTASTPRNAILPGYIVWNLNNAPVVNNIGATSLTSAGYQVPVQTLVNNGNSTNNSASQFVSIFTAGIRLDGFNQSQRIAVASAINDFSDEALHRQAVANATQVLGSTQSVSSLISSNLGEQLALTPAEIQEWDAVTINTTEAQYNMGLAVASMYKAARLGLAQDFILQIQEGDQHSEQEVALRDNAGWQIVHRNQAINFARIMNKLYTSAKNDESPYGTGKTMWEEMVGHITSDYNRSNIAQGATDSGDGASIVFGGNINPGTFYNHSSDFGANLYASDPTAGGALVTSAANLPTPPQAWRMMARAFAGNEVAQKFHNPNQLGPGGLLYSYVLKQNG